jgi:dTDP-4-dehydrorhamnose reductase
VKVLVTGASGQVGRALAETVPPGWQVSTPGRAELDITDPAALRRSLEQASPDIVINAAAYTAVDRAERESEAAYRVNAMGVEQLVQACAARSLRLVHFSTDFVFDGALSRPYLPDDRPAPQSAYGKSKLAGERAAQTLAAALIVRTGWVYGAHGANFVKTMLRLMAEQEEVRVVADQVGTPTHAHSLAAASWSLIELGASGIHHFTDAGVASWYDFAVAIEEEALAIGLLQRRAKILPIATRDYPTPARRPSYSVLDKAGTWSLLGAPARHWRVELRAMLAELKGAAHG